MTRFAESSKINEVLPELHIIMVSGWRNYGDQVPAKVQGYWNYRDELTLAHGLILKVQKILMMESLRGEMLEKLPEGHLGITKTVMRA